MSSFNEDLMSCVYQYPAIYDKCTLEYRDKHAKASAWEQVAKAMKSEVIAVTTRYNTIRTKLSKYLKHQFPSGSAATATLQPEFESLRWLIAHIDRRCTANNRIGKAEPRSHDTSEEEHSPVTDLDSDEESRLAGSQSSSGEPTSSLFAMSQPPTKKAKYGIAVASTIQRMEREAQLAKDANHLFCLSLEPKLSALSQDEREVAEIEILQVLRRARIRSQAAHPLKVDGSN